MKDKQRTLVIAVGGIQCRCLAEALQMMEKFPQTQSSVKKLKILAHDTDNRGLAFLQESSAFRYDKTNALQFREAWENENQRVGGVKVLLLNASSSSLSGQMEWVKEILEEKQDYLVLLVSDHPQNESEEAKINRAKENRLEVERICRESKSNCRLLVFHRNAFAIEGSQRHMKDDAKLRFMELYQHILWLLFTNQGAVDRMHAMVPQCGGILGHLQVEESSGITTSLMHQDKLHDGKKLIPIPGLGWFNWLDSELDKSPETSGAFRFTQNRKCRLEINGHELETIDFNSYLLKIQDILVVAKWCVGKDLPD